MKQSLETLKNVCDLEPMTSVLKAVILNLYNPKTMKNCDLCYYVYIPRFSL